MHADLERFYDLLDRLKTDPSQGRCLTECNGRAAWPKRGVYFFLEPGEYRAGNKSVPRVVRVGTHAVSANSRSSLWGRLRAHRGTKRGGGNHRGSIFRLHVGAALLARDGATLVTWGRESSAPKTIRLTEVELEARVSAHIGAMSVLWIDLPDEPGPGSARAFVERNAIGLLSNHLEPVDHPSTGWLGSHSPNDRIRNSGLWNLNHVDCRHDSKFLDLLEQAVKAT
jgi:hypothetical protein